MKELIFVDKNERELIVKHDNGVIYFERKVDIEKLNSEDEKYICKNEIRELYNFSKEEFYRFIDYCELISKECWLDFEIKEADSYESAYNDYYDDDYDSEGILSIHAGILSIEGPWKQLKSNGENVRLFKFNKNKFESFVFELNRVTRRIV